LLLAVYLLRRPCDEDCPKQLTDSPACPPGSHRLIRMTQLTTFPGGMMCILGIRARVERRKVNIKVEY
jgi:hypothetical protein